MQPDYPWTDDDDSWWQALDTDLCRRACELIDNLTNEDNDHEIPRESND